MLEAAMQEDNAFVTLTYNEESLPLTASSLPTLVPTHLQRFMKTFRRAIEPLRVRFFAVGEYGSEGGRPHYHVMLFGYPACGRMAVTGKCGCFVCSTVQSSWGRGSIHIGTVTPESASYIAGYTVKKLNKGHRDLGDRHPEFSRMSLRPGIGALMVPEIASVLLRHGVDRDVPASLSHGRRMLPLGQYLRRRLREQVGMDKNTPPDVAYENSLELRLVREASLSGGPPLVEVIKKSLGQYELNVEARERVKKKREKL